jgi:HD-like signal output (HDOD) protein
MDTTAIDFQELDKKLEKVFPMPQTLTKILATIDDPNSNLAKLEEIVKMDTNFSFKILSLANSAFYGLSQKIANMHTALSILGINVVKSLAFQASANELFSKKMETANMSPQSLWQHSVGVGVCARMTARRLKIGEAEDFFTMGILHDLGLLVEAQFYPDVLNGILEKMKTSDAGILDLEKKAFQTDHAAITHRMCEKWSLPETMAVTLKHHHSPLKAPKDHRNSAAIIYLADKLVMQAKYGFHYGRQLTIEKSILDHLGWEDVDAEILLEDFQEQEENLSSMLI